MKRKKRTRIILISILLVVLIAGGVFLVVKNYNNKKANTVPTSSTKENPEINEATARSSSEEKPNSSNNTTQNNSSVTVTITSLMQTPDSIVRVGSLVNGTSSGTCTLKFEKEGNSTIVKTAPIGMQVSYNICKGFNDISSSEFPIKGDWRTTIFVESTKGNAQSETKVINIK